MITIRRDKLHNVIDYYVLRRYMLTSHHRYIIINGINRIWVLNTYKFPQALWSRQKTEQDRKLHL